MFGNDTKGVFGPGCVHLLKRVHELGSLRQAAQEIGMSYRWAWERLKKAEQGLGFSLVERVDKGRCGRAVILTPDALELIAWFERVDALVAETLKEAEASMPPSLAAAPGRR